MKYKILFLLLSISLLNLTFSNNIDLKGCKKQKFIVSGYYSPKKGQKFYHKGNYWKEIRLNGHGYRGASGKPVFNGMIAAPKKYKFGTKIYFPGYGVGIVEDRGGAIVEAGKRGYKYDRIDIWMGKGEEALIRALSWGKKEIIGYVCPKNKKLPIGFDWGNFPIYKENFFDISVFAIELTYGRKDNWVKSMQKYLSFLGFFPKNKITGFFGPLTKKSLCNYQLSRGIVGKNDPNCGIVRGPKTRWTIKQELIKKGFLKKNFYLSYIIPNKIKKKSKHGSAPKITKLNFTRGFKKGEKSKEIWTLQYYLKKLGFYKGKLNGIYDQQTILAVYSFQKKYKILDEKAPIYLQGYFGPTTRRKFVEVIKKNL